MYEERIEESSGYVKMGNGWDYNKNMSVNASNAVEEGRLPDFWWETMKKPEILERIYKEIDRLGGPTVLKFNIEILKKAQKQALLNLFVDINGDERHHVGTRKEERPFCIVRGDLLLSVTDGQIKNEIERIRRSNSEKNFENNSIRKENSEKERIARKSKPLAVGYFTKQARYKGKDLKWNDHYIGVIDGSRLYYYGFHTFEKNVATKKRNPNNLNRRWTRWPKEGEVFETFSDFINKYPQFKNKQEEIERLMVDRKEDRAKKKI